MKQNLIYQLVARGIATGMQAQQPAPKQSLVEAEAKIAAAAARRAKKALHQASGIAPLPASKKKNQFCQDEILRQLGGKK